MHYKTVKTEITELNNGLFEATTISHDEVHASV